jgi:iron complex outermembrane receptor protein
VTITAGYTNGASEYTDGVDIDLRGQFPLSDGFGKFSTDVSATRIISFVYTQAGSAPVQYAGAQSPYNLSSGAGTPQDRIGWTNTWNWNALTLSANAYYIGAYKEYGRDVAPPYLCLGPAITGVGMSSNCRVGSFTTIDLTGAYAFTKQFSMTAMIENLADKLPPVDTADYAGVNYNPTYSQSGIVGRFFRLGLRYKY